jgi:membrane protease YdiL (CAAX protease family)
MRRVLSVRPGSLDTALFVFPLFLVYQVGIVSGGAGRNGADFLTTLLIESFNRDLSSYRIFFALLMLAYLLLLAWLRRSGRFHPRSFLPMLFESSIYALCMGSLILLVINNLLGFVPGLAAGGDPASRAPVEIVVISAGAGLHEEFIFRAGLMGGLARLLERPMGPRAGWGSALLLSSLVFAAVHHLGVAGEDFTTAAFVYRALAGVFFGIVYQLRGFAVVAWTHALYDLYVLTLV